MLDILIVDDNYDIPKILVNMIMSDNEEFKVVGIAYDGVEALQLILEKKPKVILLDLKMPKKTGLEVLKEIETIKNYDPYVIVISGYADLLYREFNSVKLCLSKPISYNNLLKILKDIIEEYNDKIIFNYITYELDQYSFNKSRIGYTYLKDAIFIAIKSDNTLKNMQNDLFEKVSTKHHTSTKKNQMVNR